MNSNHQLFSICVLYACTTVCSTFLVEKRCNTYRLCLEYQDFWESNFTSFWNCCRTAIILLGSIALPLVYICSVSCDLALVVAIYSHHQLIDTIYPLSFCFALFRRLNSCFQVLLRQCEWLSGMVSFEDFFWKRGFCVFEEGQISRCGFHKGRRTLDESH